jgi:O-antigen ligase
MMTGAISSFYIKLFDGNPPLPILAIHLPILGMMCFMMLVRIRETFFGSLSALPHILFMILAVASIRWSMDPSSTFVEAVPGLIVGMYLASAAWRYDWKQLINGIWIAMVFMVLFSFVIYFAMPTIGKMKELHDGAMMGMWMEKNTAGQIGVFGGLLALSRFTINPKTFASSGISFFVFVLFLLMTTSKGALVSFMAGCVVFGWVFIMRRNIIVFLVTSFSSIFGAIFLGQWIRGNVDVVLGLLGRSSTFTGRTGIWKAVEYGLADRPFLGHGYGAYWSENYLGTTLAFVIEDLDFVPQHAHNSLMDIKLALGQVGANLFIFSVVLYLLITIFKIRRSHGIYFVLPFMVSSLILTNFESILGFPSNYAGAVIILAAAKMARPTLIQETKSGFSTMIGWLGTQVLRDKGDYGTGQGYAGNAHPIYNH